MSGNTNTKSVSAARHICGIQCGLHQAVQRSTVWRRRRLGSRRSYKKEIQRPSRTIRTEPNQTVEFRTWPELDAEPIKTHRAQSRCIQNILHRPADNLYSPRVICTTPCQPTNHNHNNIDRGHTQPAASCSLSTTRNAYVILY
jgi:hypothetical protein